MGTRPFIGSSSVSVYILCGRGASGQEREAKQAATVPPASLYFCRLTEGQSYGVFLCVFFSSTMTANADETEQWY